LSIFVIQNMLNMRSILIKSKITFFFIPLFISLFFIQCDDTEIPFPYVPIYATLQVDTELGNLLPGQYKTINGYGVGGLIIFRVSQNEFLAFDRACTYEAQAGCVLKDEGSYFSCPCCGSQFWMVNNEDLAGTIINGPASYPLKRYSCLFNGVNTVTVTN